MMMSGNCNGAQGAVRFWFSPDGNGGTGAGAPGTLRQLAQTLHLHFPRLPWCRREELGDLLGRRHYHFVDSRPGP